MPRRITTATRKVPTQARSKAMVEALLDATARILLRHGYEALSTNRVALEAGVSIGSLYQYFPTKESLLQGVMQRWSEGTMALVIELYETMLDVGVEQGIKHVVNIAVELTRANPKLYKVLLEQVPRVGALDAREQLTVRFVELMTAWLELHRDELEVDDPAMAAHIGLRAIFALTDQALLYRPELLESKRFTQHLERLFLGYVAPSLLVKT